MSQIKELQPKEGVTLLAWLAPDDFIEFAGLVGDLCITGVNFIQVLIIRIQ